MKAVICDICRGIIPDTSNYLVKVQKYKVSGWKTQKDGEPSEICSTCFEILRKVTQKVQEENKCNITEIVYEGFLNDD